MIIKTSSYLLTVQTIVSCPQDTFHTTTLRSVKKSGTSHGFSKMFINTSKDINFTCASSFQRNVFQ